MGEYLKSLLCLLCKKKKRKKGGAGASVTVIALCSSAGAGATRTTDARELLYARQKVVVTTKAFGLQAIDMVHIDYKDVEGLRRQAREGALMGFTGKSL